MGANLAHQAANGLGNEGRPRNDARAEPEVGPQTVVCMRLTYSHKAGGELLA